MTTFEMEPAFCKALKLLHSTSKESTDEIMHLLEELIEQKYGGTKSLNIKSGTFYEEPSKPLDAPKGTSRISRGSSPAQSSTAGQTSEKSSRDSSPPSEPVSSRTSPDLDDGDLALEIFEDDLNCKICKGMSVGPRNRLVECSDCHSLYHQECHKPPISENVNDPRLVWYCSSCTKKTQEKVQTKVKSVHQVESSHKKTKTETPTESKSSSSSSSSSSSLSSSAFKRSEKSSSSSHGKSASGSGMAHLAASLQGSKSSSGTSSSSSSSSSSNSKHHSSGGSTSKSSASLNYSKTPSSPNQKSQSGAGSAPANIIAADKRLQNMKKKAAAKMQEKRSKHK